MQGSQPLVEELSNVDAAVTVLAPTNAGLALEQVDAADVRLPSCMPSTGQTCSLLDSAV